MMLESSDGKVAIEDADVQAIIASVSINEQSYKYAVLRNFEELHD